MTEYVVIEYAVTAKSMHLCGECEKKSLINCTAAVFSHKSTANMGVQTLRFGLVEIE